MKSKKFLLFDQSVDLEFKNFSEISSKSSFFVSLDPSIDGLVFWHCATTGAFFFIKKKEHILFCFLKESTYNSHNKNKTISYFLFRQKVTKSISEIKLALYFMSSKFLLLTQ